jgi:hypothetical protein
MTELHRRICDKLTTVCCTETLRTLSAATAAADLTGGSV